MVREGALGLERSRESTVLPLLIPLRDLYPNVNICTRILGTINQPIHLRKCHHQLAVQIVQCVEYVLGQSELYARLNCLQGAKSSPLAAMHLK